jgi:diguanylate cyclase (GGDEF)-like protein
VRGLRVLIAEDDAIARLVLEDRLAQWGYDVIAVEDGLQAKEALEKDNCPCLAILDWVMPEIDGLELCRIVRKQFEKPYIYILLLTAKNQKKDLVEAMEAGADDFISKPPDMNELRMRLRAGKRIITLQKELLHQTTHDSLTGLLNRFAIMKMLEKEMNRAIRNGNPLSIAMADLDNFKQINDTWGHQAGDTVLGEVAQRMELSLRSYDAVGRYGGEEFLLIFPECNKNNAILIAEKVRLAISTKQVAIPDGTLPVTASIGITTINPVKGDYIDAMVKIADRALYMAKENGRNRLEFVGGTEC